MVVRKKPIVTRRALPTLLYILVCQLHAPNIRGSEGEVANVVDVDQIVERYLNNRGGADVLGVIHTIKQTGRLTQDGTTYPMTVYYQRPNRYRIEHLVENGLHAVEAFDGHKGWRENTPFWGMKSDKKLFLPVSEIPPEETIRLQEDEADFEGPLVRYREKGHRLELIGTADVDGTSTYHLRIVLKSGRVQDWYLDERDFMPVKKIAEHYANKYQGLYGRHWYFVKHQVVSGLSLPSLYEREDIQRVRTYEIDKVEVNVHVPADLFSMPEAKSP